VDMYAIWNERTSPAALAAVNSNGTPASPRIYRSLYQAGYAGLIAAGLVNPKVLFGETAPFGQEHLGRGESKNREVSPLAFIARSSLPEQPLPQIGSCGELKMYGYSTHPYTYPSVEGVDYRPPDYNQVTIGTLSRLSMRSFWRRTRARSPPTSRS